MLTIVGMLALGAAAAAATSPTKLAPLDAATASKPPACNGGFCSSLARYPVKGTATYAEFNVPALPKKVGPTFFVYCACRPSPGLDSGPCPCSGLLSLPLLPLLPLSMPPCAPGPPAPVALALALTPLCCPVRSFADNIDWQAAGPKGSDARMNQFVPQLMLGDNFQHLSSTFGWFSVSISDDLNLLQTTQATPSATAPGRRITSRSGKLTSPSPHTPHQSPRLILT